MVQTRRQARAAAAAPVAAAAAAGAVQAALGPHRPYFKVGNAIHFGKRHNGKQARRLKKNRSKGLHSRSRGCVSTHRVHGYIRCVKGSAARGV